MSRPDSTTVLPQIVKPVIYCTLTIPLPGGRMAYLDIPVDQNPADFASLRAGDFASLRRGVDLIGEAWTMPWVSKINPVQPGSGAAE